MTLVLEGQARDGADEAELDGVAVVHAPGEGDDTIAAIAETHSGLVVVTAERALAARVRTANGKAVGPSWLLEPAPELSPTTSIGSTRPDDTAERAANDCANRSPV